MANNNGRGTPEGQRGPLTEAQRQTRAAIQAERVWTKDEPLRDQALMDVLDFKRRYPAGVGEGPSYKRGGKVKRTGPAKLHKGERVLTKTQAKKVTPAKLRAAAHTPTKRGKFPPQKKR